MFYTDCHVARLITEKRLITARHVYSSMITLMRCAMISKEEHQFNDGLTRGVYKLLLPMSQAERLATLQTMFGRRWRYYYDALVATYPDLA